MKRNPTLCLFILLLLVSSCKNEDKETSKEKKDRNMFGHRIPRGLTKTSEGLTDGYVMFAVTNSPFVYLVNRKGEVVHQWKGNYEAFNPYIQDDGSIILGVMDSDFPVFPFVMLRFINPHRF